MPDTLQKLWYSSPCPSIQQQELGVDVLVAEVVM